MVLPQSSTNEPQLMSSVMHVFLGVQACPPDPLVPVLALEEDTSVVTPALVLPPVLELALGPEPVPPVPVPEALVLDPELTLEVLSELEA